jgi:ABC-type glycerol-3-phosphate transport system substrate-binding protein
MRTVWLCLATLVPAVILGCGPNKPPPPAVVSEPVILKIACPGEPAATVVKRYAKGWASAHNTQVEIVRVPATESPGERDGIDVWVIPPPALSRLTTANLLQPVPDSLLERGNSYQWQNILPLYRHKLLAWDGTPYALPLLGAATVCYYREDWLREAARDLEAKHGRALTTPATWDDFADLAVYFHDRNKRPSLPPLPERDDEISHWLCTIAASYDRRAVREDDPKMPPEIELFSFHYDLKTMQPRLSSAAFLQALRLLSRMQACRPAGTSAEPAQAFLQGDAVLCIAGPEWIERFQKDDSKVRGKFGIARVPGTLHYFDYLKGQPIPAPGNFIPYVGAHGWLGVVPKSAPHAAEAFALLAHLSNPTTSAEVVSEPAWGGGAFRREHLTSGAWDAFGLNAERTRALVVALQAELMPIAINPVVALRIPDAARHEQILGEELRAALKEPTKDPAEALKAATRRWQELDAKKDLETRRREYRLSLGLGVK